VTEVPQERSEDCSHLNVPSAAAERGNAHIAEGNLWEGLLTCQEAGIAPSGDALLQCADILLSANDPELFSDAVYALFLARAPSRLLALVRQHTSLGNGTHAEVAAAWYVRTLGSEPGETARPVV
jgi:hypothetical protein